MHNSPSQDKLTATSTCGLRRKETYCILSHLDRYKSFGGAGGPNGGGGKNGRRTREKCFWCDSTPDGVRNK